MEHELEALASDNYFIHIRDVLVAQFYLKLEFLNPAGSGEFNTAISRIRNCEAAGLIKRDTVLVDASSGSLGVALAMICAERGYRFRCVVDSEICIDRVRAMRALGAEIICISDKDVNGECPDIRLEYIRALTSEDSRYVWINQYRGPANADMHAERTAAAIVGRFPRVSYLFVATQSMEMLTGCTRYFSQWRPETKIVAVDSASPITSLSEPESDRIHKVRQRSNVYATVAVPEAAMILSCRYLARSYGVLAGGSTGAVLAAVLSLREKFYPGEVVVAIAPDTGEQYLETIYDDEWVTARHGGDTLLPERYTGVIESCVTA